MGIKKGSAYEREFCKLLGLWWTGGERDDIFWRTAGSGGMATNRRRRGKAAAHQHGDIQATDPIGLPLTSLATIELKRGYKDAHVGDMMDRSFDIEPRIWEAFLEQAQRESNQAKTPHWILIVRRDKRVAVIYISLVFYGDLIDVGANLREARPSARIRPIRGDRVFCCHLDTFLKIVTPEHIKAVCSELI